MNPIDPTLEIDPEVDMAIDNDPNLEPSNPNATNIPPEPRMPTRKDISLRDFLAKMDDYAPIVRPKSRPDLKHVTRSEG